ncbi:MAG: hypothetical protein IPJ13_17435 [Saprospiraceae bacterium]|nr:hypothetical protein [Saprospiraceae bacterium]
MNKLIYTGVIALLALISCTKDDQIVSKLTDQEKIRPHLLRQEEKTQLTMFMYMLLKSMESLFLTIFPIVNRPTSLI